MTFEETFGAFKYMIAEGNFTKTFLVAETGISSRRLDEILIKHDCTVPEYARIAYALGVDIRFSIEPIEEADTQ